MSDKLLAVALVLVATVFAGCSGDRQERGLVRDFMKQSLGGKDFDVVEWSPVDSTFFVSDSMLQVMRSQAASKVQGEVSYVAPTAKLLYLRLRFAVDNDTLQRTFYFDDKASGIVGFKEN